MEILRRKWESLRQGYSKATPMGIALIIVCFIPDWHARIAEWAHIVKWAFLHLDTGWARLVIVVLALLLIWQDHIRTLRKRGIKSYDESTLDGRLAKARDELLEFYEGLGKARELDYGVNETEWKTQRDASKERADLLHYGFQLKFSERIQQLLYEVGYAGRLNPQGSPQKRPMVVTSKPANGTWPGTRLFYSVAS